METKSEEKHATVKEKLTVGAQKAVEKAKAATTWWGRALWLLAGAVLAAASMCLTGCTVSWSIGADGSQLYEHTIIVPSELCK